MQKFSSAHAFATFGLNEAEHMEKLAFTTGLMSRLAQYLGKARTAAGKARGVSALKDAYNPGLVPGAKSTGTKLLGLKQRGLRAGQDVADWGAQSGRNAALVGGGGTALAGLGLYGAGDAIHTGRRERRRRDIGV